MPHSPYARFASEELTLRDLLAVDRTVVANERTLLGYVRTTLALLAAGASLLHFFEDAWWSMSGWALVGIAVPIGVVGIWHYLRRRGALVPLIRREGS